jgi:mono/diheme cytochrome c family protein
MLAVLPMRGAESLPPGKRLYSTKCARCHQLYDPAAYDEKKWNMWMEKMRQKTRLTDNQFKQLDEYTRSLRETKAATKK